MPNSVTAWFAELRGLSGRWQQLSRSTNSTPPMKLQISNDQPCQFGSITTWCYGVVIVWTCRHNENQKRWISSPNWRGWSPGKTVIAVRHRIHNSLPMKPTQPTNQPTLWSTVLSEKLTVLYLVKKYPVFYGTHRFITAFTTTSHLSLTWAKAISSMPPHPTSWRSILILSSYLFLGLPSGLFPSGLLTKTLHAHLLPPMRATCPALSFLLSWSY